ncbi:MAG: TetR/AcrR family transcriptional regulator [Solirubrobacteraceae bacterium]
MPSQRTPREPPPPARALAREQVLATQRLALMGAMIDAVGENGYQATSVENVVKRAGVARKTFYAHFANKQQCLLEAHELIVGATLERVERAYLQAEGRLARAHAAIGAVFEAALENPNAVRLSVVEIAAAGPAGIELRERALERFEHFIAGALELGAGEGVVSATALKVVIGGVNRVLYQRVHRAKPAELLALVPALASWATSYHPAPAEVLTEPRGDPLKGLRAAGALDGGRAPGTLAPHARLHNRRGLRGEQGASKAFIAHSQRERILDAVVNLTAEEGYSELKVDDIARQAAVSLDAFYEHFADKEDAFLAAYEIGHAKSLAIVERAYSAQPDWRLGVRAALSALFDFLASEPSYAHIALLDALIASTRTAERSTDAVGAYGRILIPGMEQAPAHARPPAVTIDAIVGGIFELCLHHALQGQITELPDLTVSATYIALAPFIGAEEAARIAIEPT